MTHRDLRFLFVFLFVSASACGLAKGGLLEAPDASEPVADATSQDEPTPGDEPSGTPPDDGATSDVDATGTPPADASEAATATPEAGLDAHQADDAPLRTPDASPDVRVDSPADVANDAVDSPPDGPPAPLAYDGGVVADPTFFDDEWVTFCAALVGCGELPSLSGCVALLKQPTVPDLLIPPDSMVTGVGDIAPDCQAVRDMLGDGLPCTAPDTCSGGLPRHVPLGLPHDHPVRAARPRVLEQGSGNAGCGFGDCDASQEGQTYCAGTYVTTCTGGRYVPSLDCNVFGATCAGVAGSAACAAQEGAPARRARRAATAPGWSSAWAGGRAPSTAATATTRASPCFTDVQGTPTCALGASCDPATTVDTCNPDGTISFCNAGVPDLYGCTGANLWSGCSAGACTP